ncbi:MAG: hemerythrin family protein [Magnetococcales bacterium]|nr:hemerythrin family protein [Magnetococcales bacterium]
MMDLYNWNDAWNTGHAQIDQQHYKIFLMFRVLNDAWDCGFGGSVVDALSEELTAYAEEHFSFEEKVLAEAGYPDLPHHQETHAQLKEQVQQFRAQLAETTDREALSYDFGNFLKKWLIEHIIEEDQKYAPTLYKSP